MPLLLGTGYNARVLAYSDVDARHVRTRFWAGRWGDEFSPNLQFAQLVVCELPDEAGVHLLCLDARGAAVFSSVFETVEAAKSEAEAEFSGLRATWQSA